MGWVGLGGSRKVAELWSSWVGKDLKDHRSVEWVGRVLKSYGSVSRGWVGRVLKGR